MSDRSRVTLSWPLAAAGAIVLVLAGAAIALLALRRSAADSGTAAPAATAPPPASQAVAPSGDAAVVLTPEMAARAGIEVATVRAGDVTARVRIPGTIQPNAYREVIVTPLVGGRVTRVQAALGEPVKRGQTLAQIYSPELAAAQTEFIGLRATLDAAHQRLMRTKRLAEIGAASRQELEQIEAEHTHHATAVESARSRLVLLGIPRERLDRLSSASQIGATVSVPAPIAGVITKRDANVGVNVEPSTQLFTVVDLSNVWVVADLYERHFAGVRVGSPAIVTSDAYPGLRIDGRVSYIDPQVQEETRTAKLRVEVPNPGGRLRLGMYVDVSIGEAISKTTLAIPRGAVQTIGDRTVVYVAADQPGRYVERDVRLGAIVDDRVEVLDGLSTGDRIVTKGAFFLRAERERVSPRSARSSPSSSAEPPPIEVTEQGFVPSSVTVAAGTPVRLTFVRRTENTCGTAVTIPDHGITRDLPLNTPVVVEFSAKKKELQFTCGMQMLKGRIIVR